MSSTTFSHHDAPATTRFVPKHSQGVSQVLPMLVAFALLAAAAVVSVLICGPVAH